MLEHPGVICYHVEYPSDRVSDWIEIYANDDAFRAHLANEKGKGPLAALAGDCDKITVRCFGDPDAGSREILRGLAPSIRTRLRMRSFSTREPTGIRRSERGIDVGASERSELGCSRVPGHSDRNPPNFRLWRIPENVQQRAVSAGGPKTPVRC